MTDPTDRILQDLERAALAAMERGTRFPVHPGDALALIERLRRTERNRDMWRGQSERQAEALRAAREELRRIYEDQAELAKFHLGASAPQPYTGTGAADMARAGYPSAPGHPGSIY
jgi:hypothetical protein